MFSLRSRCAFIAVAVGLVLMLGPTSDACDKAKAKTSTAKDCSCAKTFKNHGQPGQPAYLVNQPLLVQMVPVTALTTQTAHQHKHPHHPNMYTTQSPNIWQNQPATMQPNQPAYGQMIPVTGQPNYVQPGMVPQQNIWQYQPTTMLPNQPAYGQMIPLTGQPNYIQPGMVPQQNIWQYQPVTMVPTQPAYGQMIPVTGQPNYVQPGMVPQQNIWQYQPTTMQPNQPVFATATSQNPANIWQSSNTSNTYWQNQSPKKQDCTCHKNSTVANQATHFGNAIPATQKTNVAHQVQHLQHTAAAAVPIHHHHQQPCMPKAKKK